MILFIKTFCKIKSELKNQPPQHLTKNLQKRADALASAPKFIYILYYFLSAIAACAAASLAIGTLNGEHDT